MKERIVCIEWDDASSASGIYDKEDAKRYEPIRTKTIGFVVESNRKYLITAEDTWVNNNGKRQYRNTSSIPRGMIQKITELKE